MANNFTIRANAASPSNTVKVACSIASTSTKTAKLTQLDISFDGVDNTKTPILVELVRTTSAPSGGASHTPALLGGDASVTSNCTARINDTTDGGSPTVLLSWYVPPTGGLSIQFPLGREPSLKISDFLELRVTTVTASGTPNYAAAITFEE